MHEGNEATEPQPFVFECFKMAEYILGGPRKSFAFALAH
jgi:hypothetical protein